MKERKLLGISVTHKPVQLVATALVMVDGRAPCRSLGRGSDGSGVLHVNSLATLGDRG